MEVGGELYSKTLTMDEATSYFDDNGIKPEWDEELGLYYGEYVDGDSKYMFWAEEERSLSAKLDAVKGFGAAGYAFWRLGHEADEIWSVIAKYE